MVTILNKINNDDAIITKIGQIDSAGKITIKTIEEFTNSYGIEFNKVPYLIHNETTYQNVSMTNHIDNISAIQLSVIFNE